MKPKRETPKSKIKLSTKITRHIRLIPSHAPEKILKGKASIIIDVREEGILISVYVDGMMDASYAPVKSFDQIVPVLKVIEHDLQQ